MKITLLKPFKSLQPFTSEELNDFTIITGKNGSGKSQLLELLDEKLYENEGYFEFNYNDETYYHRLRIVKDRLNKNNVNITLKNYDSELREINSLFAFNSKYASLIDYIANNNLEKHVFDPKRESLLNDSDAQPLLLVTSAVYAPLFLININRL